MANRKTYLDPEIVGLFCSCFSFPGDLVVQLIYTTGLRVREVFAIRKQDVDLENREIRIRPPDSSSVRRRSVFFPVELIPGIHQALNVTGGEFLLFSPRIHGFSMRTFENHLVAVRESTGIEVTIENLRGSFIVNLLNRGVHPRNIQRVLGMQLVGIKTTSIIGQFRHFALEVPRVEGMAPLVSVKKTRESGGLDRAFREPA